MKTDSFLKTAILLKLIVFLKKQMAYSNKPLKITSGYSTEIYAQILEMLLICPRILLS